jgi:DNA polymerase-3 subunit alpha
MKGWCAKKIYCDSKGIKYIHAVECYLTEDHKSRLRDNYHTILIAKNFAGVKELNAIISKANSEDDHFYYVGRISFDEFFSLSNNIIKISACLASPLNKMNTSHPLYEKLVQSYDYLEIQPHKCKEQIAYNKHLATLADIYHKPLIAATDAHSLNGYKAECREILLYNKKQFYENESEMDLTFKSYDELVKSFKEQDAIPEQLYLQAIENTNVMADSVESFELDTSLKYPILYGSYANDEVKFIETIERKFTEKVKAGIIPKDQIEPFKKAISEEIRVFKKLEMCGFMLSMSELLVWSRNKGIPIGPGRGSVAGSRVAYILDITDVNPEKWNTVFSRFCNEDRKEVGDVDIDIIDSDRSTIISYIVDRFGVEKTARVPSYQTAQDLAAIDLIGRALRFKWEHDNPDKKDFKGCKYSIGYVNKAKKEFSSNESKARAKYPDIFYYYDGILGVKTSQSVHPAGIVISPITLADNYGVFKKDGMLSLQIDMEEIHEVSLVKYDLLGLKTVQVLFETCKLANIPYPKSHEINWEDEKVWEDMLRCPYGIFQMEGAYAFRLLKQFAPKNIFDMSLVTAALRPSGDSYRDKLIKKELHKNPSPMIDELFKNNYGYLVYQEDVIKFLTDICGLSGSEADNVRRAIGRKDEARLNKALPDILEGYCKSSTQQRNIAETEAKEFIQILKDSASYMFGYNHSIAYCMIGYLCAYLRYYYPYEFCTAYLNCAKSSEQILQGEEIANVYGIIITQPKYGASLSNYYFNKDEKIIAKGVGSIKYLSDNVAENLMTVAKQEQPTTFIDLLILADHKYHVGLSKIEILIELDFFNCFGNRTELLNVFHFYLDICNRGQAKSISCKKLDSFVDSVAKNTVKNNKFTSNIGANGKALSTYNILNINEMMNEYERETKNLRLKDWSYDRIIDSQEKYLGTVDIKTNKPEDRQNLLITDVRELVTNNNCWGYALFTRSIGTGKSSRITARSHLYKLHPVKENSIIHVELSDLCKNKKGFWNIYNYKVLKE